MVIKRNVYDVLSNTSVGELLFVYLFLMNDNILEVKVSHYFSTAYFETNQPKIVSSLYKYL